MDFVHGALPDGRAFRVLTIIDQWSRWRLPERCLYLIAGLPGTGKTTLAMQLLLEGVRLGERCLYISLSETKAEIGLGRLGGPDTRKTCTTNP